MNDDILDRFPDASKPDQKLLTHFSKFLNSTRTESQQ
jgi:hypothetical protein